MWLSKRRYVLVNIDTKEDVYKSKELLPKEVVLEDIESDNLEEALYRLEERVSGRKVRNAWVMRKPRTPKSPEELAQESREKAELYIQERAIHIKKEVEEYKAFVAKTKDMYNIEGGAVDKIDIPTGTNGKLSILGAANQAIAESTYLGIRETKPSEVAATVKSVMDSGTTILAGIAQMFATRLAESNNRKKKPAEKKKEPEKKKEDPKPVKNMVEPKELATHKEDLGEGIIKTTFGTFGTEQNTTTSVPDSTTTSLIDEDNDLYEQYKIDLLGSAEEEKEEEPEKE